MELTPELQQIYNNLIMPVDTNISFDSVILSDENKEKMQEFIAETSYRDKFLDYGLQPMNRLLFYGASGCGKTYSAKALSNYLQYTMLTVNIATSLSEGSVAINISNVFKLANKLKNCLLFFDECDSIAWSRDSGIADSGDVRRATNSLFQHLDQLDSSNIFIAATNMLHRLDPAFERRFNMKLEFRRPNVNLKETSKKFLFDKFTLIDDADSTTTEIVERRSVLSYYEIQGIVERAMKHAIMNDTKEVRTSELYKDYAQAMKIKLRFHTDKDPEEAFQSSIE